MTLPRGVGTATQQQVIPLYLAEGVGDFDADVFIPRQATGAGSALSTLTQPIANGSEFFLEPSASTTSGATRSSGITYNALHTTPQPYLFDPDATLFRRVTSGLLADDLDPAASAYGAQDVRAFAYGWNATDSVFERLRATTAGVLRTAPEGTGTLTTVADEPTNDTTNTSIAAANANRKQIIVQNVDATDAVRIGDTNITTTRGIRLAAGESVTLGAQDLRITEQIFARAEANTPSVAVTEIRV